MTHDVRRVDTSHCATGRSAEAYPETADSDAERLSGSRKRSIIFVVPDFEPRAGGAERQTANQGRALARRGHRVTVLTRRQDQRWPRREVLGGLEVVRLGLAGRGRFADKAMVMAVARWLWRRRPTIGIVNVVGYPDYVFGAAAAGLLSGTVVLWLGQGDATDILGRAGRGLRHAQRRLRHRLLSRCAHVALTWPIASELESVGLGARLTVIPVPVDRSHHRPPSEAERAESRRLLDLAGDRLVVVYTGSLRALKGVDRLLDAFAMLAVVHPAAHLLIVGEDRGAKDDAGPIWRRRAEATDLMTRVTFTGRVEDVRPHLWAADVFVLPSSREGLSNSVLEAMACGLACIVPASAAGEQSLFGGAGIVPQSNDIEHLLPALREVAEDRALRVALGRAATQRVAAYDLETVTDAYESLYGRLRREIA